MDVQLVRRPGRATEGRPIKVETNTFGVSRAPDYQIYQYDVKVVSPRGGDDAAPRLKRKVMAALLDATPELKSVHLIYDGNKIAFVPRNPMPFQTREFRTVLPDDVQRQPPRDGRPPRDETWRVTFTQAGTSEGQLSPPINIETLKAFCNGAAPDKSSLMAITALNVLLRHGPSHDSQNAVKGSSIYPGQAGPQDRFYIGGGVEMWRGFYSSLRPSPQRLILNVDSTAIAMVRPGNLPEVMGAYLGITDVSRLGNISDGQRVRLNRFLRGVGVKVMVGASREPQRRKIAAYDAQPASVRSFTDQDGRTWTVQEYFRSLNVNLRFPQLGCVRLTKMAWYPLEVVTVEPGHKVIAKLDPDQIAKVLEFTSKRPREKRDLIRTGLQKLGYNSNPTMQAWNMQLDGEPLQFNARVLPPVNLLGGGAKQTALVRGKDDGQYDARSKAFFKPASISSWTVIVFDTQQGDGRRTRGVPLPAVQGMVTQLAQACQQKGMQVVNPTPQINYVGDIHPSEVGKQFYEIITKELGGKKPQLIVCFLPSKTAPQYNAIKRLGDTLQGFATQCLCIEKAIKRDQSYYQNVALKVNMKLGGINVIAGQPFPVTKSPDNDPVIIFGADVAHPGPGSLNPSVASVVATTDIYSVSYSTQTRAQGNRVEVIAELEGMANQLIKDFYRLTKKKPNRIVFYRDGVSEGQFDKVVLEEVAQLRRACTLLEPGYAPKITYIICGKRHHIRLFPTTAPPPGAKNHQYNVPAGTHIDDGVIHPTYWDWYAVHHAGMLGTSRPCHYTVLVDENGFTADSVQSMTNTLAWLFQRCSKAVNIASPAYFAHLACERGSKHLAAARTGDDDSATLTSDSAGQEQVRETLLADARSQLRPYHANLLGTMPWM